MFDARTNVVAELTPSGRGAVAVVVVSGPDAIALVGSQFMAASRTPLIHADSGRILFGRWGGKGGEELVVCRRSEEQIEIHCHGGEAAADAVIGSLVKLGCLRISWQDWLRSSRDAAPPNAQHPADAITREAQIALASASTTRTAAVLLDQLHGALSQQIERAIAAVEARDWSGAAATLDRILEFEDLGRHLMHPWRVVLSGPPNVGKSSLLNAIAGYQRAIVSAQPGTTRDVVTLTTAIDGWPVELADTAGIRAGQSELETAGISLAKEAAASADLLIVVSEPGRPRPRPGSGTSRLATTRELHVTNKIDLLDPAQIQIAAHSADDIAVSAATGTGLETLLEAIATALVPAVPPPGTAVPFTREQSHQLASSRAAVDARDVAIALDSLQALLAN